MNSKNSNNPNKSLFLNLKPRDIAFFSLFCALIFAINVMLHYKDFNNYTKTKNAEITGQVINQYKKQKGNREYFVLKIKDKNSHIFYTTSYLDLKDLNNKYVQIYGRLHDCDFLGFLKSCFVQNYSLALLPNDINKNDFFAHIKGHIFDLKNTLKNYINLQHQNTEISSFYRAIFLGDKLEPSFRNLATLTGSAHLFAISGFHLGILSFFAFLILRPFYRIAQHYFPYRNTNFDVGFIVLFGLFFYLILLDFQASFLRAFSMALFAFIVLYSGFRLFSFGNLFVISAFLIAQDILLLTNIGFILSVCGIFYVLLFLHHVRLKRIKNSLARNVILVLLFNAMIFTNMSVIVHYFFAPFSTWQFISPLLSIAFIIFFPIMLILHIIGSGNLFDFALAHALNLDINYSNFITPFWLLLIFVILSILSIFKRSIYILLNALSIVFLGFLFIMSFF
ncbi:MAG: ComEC/Rec2 family competence protein [Helicobacter sp.]|nr:ComEC/Rec2 family competence protein [Helicobacter sp.]